MGDYRILVKGIVKREDKYLIVQKWYDDNIIDPYQWEFVDGEAEFGEAPETAVERIVQEQTGLIVVADRILYTWTFMLGSVCTLGLTYLCQTAMDENSVQLSEELQDAKWVYPNEFEEWIRNQRMLEDLEQTDIC